MSRPDFRYPVKTSGGSASPRVEVIGNATLYLGDAYEIRPTLGWFDADVMDPPYAFRAEGGGGYRRERTGMAQILEEGLNTGFDHSVINPLLCAAVVVFCHNDQLPKLLPYLDGSFKRQAVCIWRKKNPQPIANKHYQPVMEFYVHAWNDGYHPQGALADLDRQIVAMSPRGPAKFGHPTVRSRRGWRTSAFSRQRPAKRRSSTNAARRTRHTSQADRVPIEADQDPEAGPAGRSAGTGPPNWPRVAALARRRASSSTPRAAGRIAQSAGTGTSR